MPIAVSSEEPTRLIATPVVEELEISPASRPTILEPYHVDLLPSYSYVQREYLISGTAAGDNYCTRILLRCPLDSSRFSGMVVCEPAHIWSGTSIWRAINRWLMRNGHAWLEVDSQAPVAIGSVKASDPSRYASITFPPSLTSKDFAKTIPFTPDPTRQALEDEYSSFMLKWWNATPQSPDILAAASFALRSGQLGLKAEKVMLAGLSQTGGVVRRFLTHSSNIRLPDGSLPFDVLLPCASGGAALPDPPQGVKVIELLGEAEFQSVRWACGVSGQARGLSHRRPDSDSFRLYEVAGMAHRESRHRSELDKIRLKDCDLRGAEWSTFPNSFIYAAVFESALYWVAKIPVAPPAGRTLETVGDSDEIARDEHGNARGGVRSLHLDVPTSKMVSATPMGRPSWYCGSEWAFTSEKLGQLYDDVAGYRLAAGQSIEKQVLEGFLLPADAERLRTETVESVLF